MIRTWGRYEVAVIWNWPVVAFTFLLCRYRPEDDPRAWHLRVRCGPWKIEVVRQR